MANEEIREENIKKVLNCAIECFKIHGLEATTVTMVAKKLVLQLVLSKDTLVTK